MAGKKPGLITGSNAKIVLDGKTIAYATDIQYSVETAIIPIEVMGRYEVVTHEPIATSVGGSFSVVRYTSLAVTAGLPQTAQNGNGVGNLTNGMAKAFDPGSMLATETVDLIIYQKKKANASDATDIVGEVQSVVKVTDCRLTRMAGSVNKRGVLMENYAFVGVLFSDDSFVASASGVGTDLS